MTIAEVDTIVESGFFGVDVVDRQFDESGEREQRRGGERWFRGGRYSKRRVSWYSSLANRERLAVAAFDHFNCAALLTMRPHCAFAISVGIC